MAWGDRLDGFTNIALLAQEMRARKEPARLARRIRVMHGALTQEQQHAARQRAMKFQESVRRLNRNGSVATQFYESLALSSRPIFSSQPGEELLSVATFWHDPYFQPNSVHCLATLRLVDSLKEYVGKLKGPELAEFAHEARQLGDVDRQEHLAACYVLTLSQSAFQAEAGDDEPERLGRLVNLYFDGVMRRIAKFFESVDLRPAAVLSLLEDENPDVDREEFRVDPTTIAKGLQGELAPNDVQLNKPTVRDSIPAQFRSIPISMTKAGEAIFGKGDRRQTALEQMQRAIAGGGDDEKYGSGDDEKTPYTVERAGKQRFYFDMRQIPDYARQHFLPKSATSTASPRNKQKRVRKRP